MVKRVEKTEIHDILVWSERCQEQFAPWHVVTEEVERSHLIAEAGISELYSGYRLGRTRPRFHLLVYTESGRGDFFTPSTTVLVETGFVLVVPSGQPFGYVPAEEPWRFAWIHLADVERWSHLVMEGPVVKRTKYGPAMLSLMDAFIRECRDPRSDAREATGLYARLILLHVERELGSWEPQAVANHRVQLHDLWELVNGDLRRPWSVEAMAERLNTSAPSFYRLCKKYTRLSPMKMVQRLRMERAQELLVLHDYPVATIAEMVGYHNEFAFAVAFKRFSGNTPAEFRKRR